MSEDSSEPLEKESDGEQDSPTPESKDLELEDEDNTGEAKRIASPKKMPSIHRVQQQYSGPTPPASELKKIKDAVGVEYVDRIFRMAETEQQQRIERNKEIVRSETLSLTISTISIPIIGGGALASATVIAIYGNPALATAVGLAGIVASVVGALARFRGFSKKDEDSKSESNGESKP